MPGEFDREHCSVLERVAHVGAAAPQHFGHGPARARAPAVVGREWRLAEPREGDVCRDIDLEMLELLELRARLLRRVRTCERVCACMRVCACACVRALGGAV